MEKNKLSTFLKWPGGKRWLIPTIQEIVKNCIINRYFEPFLGGGSIYFALGFKKAYLSDSNIQLISTYKIVKECPGEIIDRLKKIPIDKSTYYKIRSEEPVNEIEMAVRFLYLNRLAFGGMYRVNKNGKFNVPYGGRSTSVLWEHDLIEKASQKLSSVDLVCQDFENAISEANHGDLVYCDPPYTVAHNLNGFQRYNESIFTWEDQKRLKKSCELAAERGVRIIVSNAANDSLEELYSPVKPSILSRYSGLSTDPKKRKQVNEYLFLYNI